MPKDKDTIPYVPDELLRHLEQAVPEKCPSITQPDREIWFYAGRRSLVTTLRMWNEQNTSDKKQE